MNKEHIISANATILDALKRLNALPGNRMTLIAVDEMDHLIGTVTDGDIRRALLRGCSPDSKLEDVAFREFRCVKAGDSDVMALKEMRQLGISLIPVVTEDGRLTDILDLSEKRTRLPVRAIVMAGGKGERLRPATLTTPKPLLEIEGKAIIDYNIEALTDVGIEDITVTARYLADQIKAHFARPVAGVCVKVVEEDIPLGTIGSVSLCGVADKQHIATLVMNSDLLTTISFEDLYLKHHDSGADVTIAVIPYQVSVPYAILSLDNENSDKVTGIEEKPSFSYYANAGIYMFSQKVLDMLVPGKRCDATELIEQAISSGYNVAYYPIQGTWIDVGSPVDFRQASELMRHHNSFDRS